jgi:NADH:quinone reductase (non-electrogenic)
VNMGTRFCATVEAPMHDNIKRALVEANEVDTRLIFRTLKNTARVLKNEISETVVQIEAQPGETDFADLRPLVAGVRGKAALASGDVDGGIITAGMVVGLIDDIPTCAELIQRMVREARENLARASSYF